MNIAALIVVVAALAVGALVPYGIAWAVERWWRRLPFSAYWVAIVGGLLGAVAGLGIVNDWFTGAAWNERVPVAKVLPYMNVIRAREPALYERLETSILRDQQDGKTPEEVRANAKAAVASYVADKTPFLPDDLTYELYATQRDALAYLADRREFETCAALALGRAREDVDAKLTPDLIERNTVNTTRVLAAARDTAAQVMTNEQFVQVTAEAFADASQATGIPPEEVDVLLGGSGDASKTCRIMKAFFDALLMQPVGVAAAALRTLAQGERGGR